MSSWSFCQLSQKHNSPTLSNIKQPKKVNKSQYDAVKYIDLYVKNSFQ